MNNDEQNPTKNPSSEANQASPYNNLFYDVPDEEGQSLSQTKAENAIPPQASQPETQPQPEPETTPALIAQSSSEQQPADQAQFNSQQQPQPTQSSGQSGSEPQSSEPVIAMPAGLSEEEKKRRHLVMLEAALYVAGRPLDLNEVCWVINSRSKKRGQQLIKELQQEYAAKNTALEILELRDERFVLQLKAEFTPLVKKLVNRPLLSSGPLKTLSYIAYRQPISQKRVIEVRGQHAYGHIKTLREMDLIEPERNGRQIMLKTTDYFADYFGLAQDVTTMKRDLKRIFGEFPVKTESQTDTGQQQKDEQTQ